MKLTDDEVSKANGGMGINMRTMKVCPYCDAHFICSEKAFNDHVESCNKLHSSKGHEVIKAPMSVEEYQSALMR